MQQASRSFTDEQRSRVSQAVSAAEARTSCEIVPVVATASGRYDRAEGIAGLWLAVIAAVIAWLTIPRSTSTGGDWSRLSLTTELAILVAAIVLAFCAGAWLATNFAALRRLFTPKQQMHDEVNSRARQLFFDRRVHHTAGATGVLIYVSLYEHIAVVLGDRNVIEKLGQSFLDDLCRELTAALCQTHPADALCTIISSAASRLAAVLPRSNGDTNELSDALVLID